MAARLNRNRPVCMPTQMFCSRSSNKASTVLPGGLSGVETRVKRPSRNEGGRLQWCRSTEYRCDLRSERVPCRKLRESSRTVRSPENRVNAGDPKRSPPRAYGLESGEWTLRGGHLENPRAGIPCTPFRGLPPVSIHRPTGRQYRLRVSRGRQAEAYCLAHPHE